MHQSRATGVRGFAPRSRSRTGRRPSAGRASGGGGKSKLSDELGYASGDCERRITVDFASCRSRHGKYNLRGRAERLSSARDSVHTRASRYGGLGFETRAARARGVPFRFGSRDGDAFVGRHPARRETHCARWRGWGVVAKETGERSRTRTRTIDRSVGRSVVVFGIRAPVPSDDDSRGAKNTNERNPLRGSSSPSPRAVGRVRGWRHGRTRG